MPKPQPKKQVTIHQVLAALLDEATPFPPTYLHQFSDLEGVNLDALATVWPQVHPDRRVSLMEDLEQLSDADTLVSFDSVAQMAMRDSDARVRTIAIRLLWEADQPRLIKPLIAILQKDPEIDVRAVAATALGKFVYLGELEEISAESLRLVEEALIKVMRSQEEAPVRHRALESLGFSGRKEVKRMLRSAYDTGETDWVVSAIIGIGRSADTSWEPLVMRLMRDDHPEIQAEAIRAAGELELPAARRPLLNLLEHETIDSDVRDAAIWSLSKIGGEGVRDALETLLEEAEEEDDIDYLESALDSLSFTEEMSQLGMFDFSDQAMLEDEGEQSNLDEDEDNSESSGPARRPPQSKR
jgi:HEAT repeat protein